MGRTCSIAARILSDQAQDERRRQAAIDASIKRGPPLGSGVTASNWTDWHRYRFWCCPGEKRELICKDDACRIGSACVKMKAKGLTGFGQPLARKDLPACGAKTRAGGECQLRIEPGKRRCRLHGGKSTGAKTEAGRQRIAEAQRRRWAQAKGGEVFSLGNDQSALLNPSGKHEVIQTTSVAVTLTAI